MQISAEKLIAPAVLIAATSVAHWHEVKFGAFGVSIEHFLLIVYFCFLIFKNYNFSSIEFGFAALVTAVAGIFGAASVQAANAHLVSLVVLSLMFPLFINFFKAVPNPQRVITVALALIVVQCVFFSNESVGYSGDWDNVSVPGLGVIQRLAILGFVSNSLGMMLFPICIYFLHEALTRNRGRVLNYLLFLITFGLIIATFSRTALVLVVSAIALLLKIKVLIAVVSLSFLLAIFYPFELIGSFILAFDRDQALLGNARFDVWMTVVSDWGGGLIITGRGLQNPAMDNTYLSIVTGTGILGMLALVFFLFALVRWLFRMRRKLTTAKFRTLFLIVGGILISANTYDIFSQRKILFGVALIIGALLVDDRNLHSRR